MEAMTRRQFIVSFMGSVAAVWWIRLPIAHAQEPGRIYRLGMMTGAARAAPRMAAFFDELKVFGFVEGQNLNVVAGGFAQDDQFAGVAARLAKAAPDAVFCVSDTATRAMELAHPVPIVALSSDLVAAGFVHSLARPGGNITGVSILEQIPLDFRHSLRA
jgi:putative ABC transport system substrate-binding protein